MSSINHYPPQNRVPGLTQTRKDHALNKDLTKLTRRELLDLKYRQTKLLENKSQLSKLPDKGKRIEDLYIRAVAALELKNETDATANLLSALNLGASDVDDIEWNEKSKPKELLDSDDDEDPIAILTSSNSVRNNQRIVKEETDQTLVTENDIKEAREIESGSLKLDPVLENVCLNENLEPPHRFLLNKPKTPSTTSSTSSLDSTKENKKIRDNTAASPPVQTQGAKMLPLREAIELENQQRKNMKDIHEKQAADRLAIKKTELGYVQESVADASYKPEANSMSKYRLASSFIEEGDDQDQDSMSEGEDGYED